MDNKQDSDNDGQLNKFDADDDNDGVPDEDDEDANGDGTIDCAKIDSDGDGIPNYIVRKVDQFKSSEMKKLFFTNKRILI